MSDVISIEKPLFLINSSVFLLIYEELDKTKSAQCFGPSDKFRKKQLLVRSTSFETVSEAKIRNPEA